LARKGPPVPFFLIFPGCVSSQLNRDFAVLPSLPLFYTSLSLTFYQSTSERPFPPSFSSSLRADPSPLLPTNGLRVLSFPNGSIQLVLLPSAVIPTTGSDSHLSKFPNFFWLTFEEYRLFPVKLCNGSSSPPVSPLSFPPFDFRPQLARYRPFFPRPWSRSLLSFDRSDYSPFFSS